MNRRTFLPGRLARLGAGLVAASLWACGADGGASSGTGQADAGSDTGSAAISGLGPLSVSMQDGKLSLSWPEDEWPHHCVVLRQPGKSAPIQTSLCTKETGQVKVTLGPEAGKGGVDYAWMATAGFVVGKADWELKGGDTTWGVTPKLIAKGTLEVGARFDGPCATATTKAKGLEQWHTSAPVTLDVSVELGAAARSDVEICTPEIFVDTVAAKGSTAAGGTIAFSYKADTPGMYTVEVNNTGGGAILNCAIYVAAGLPLVSVSKSGGNGLAQDPTAEQLASYRQKLLDLTNAERAKVNLPALQLADTLNKMAQYHSEDMAKSGYFGHDSPSGESVGDRAKKFGWTKGVGENIASDGSIEGAHNGLFWSAGHRKNMLSKWSVVGFGVAKDGKGSNMLVTENFGD